MRCWIPAVATSTVLLAVACPATALPPAGDGAPVDVPVPAGWQAVAPAVRYPADRLSTCIGGAAALFLDYGCRELVALDAARGDTTISLHVYDMGRPLDAFGIFALERPAGDEGTVRAGAAAVLQPPYRALLLKDRFYVKVEATRGDLDAQALRAIVEALAAGLPGGDELPPELSWLPDAGRIPGSTGYASRDYLGLGELRGCVHATYRDPATSIRYRLFAFAPPAGFFETLGRSWHLQERGGERVAWREVPSAGVVVLVGDEHRLDGVADLTDLEAALAALGRARVR
ncbi:MAG TPA: hypothetical protein PLL30_10570 [Candidatus Krumholzibacteria bacterium]|nr:hypothetical protein [Candidatus Krumholzibacteria bacterium]HPD72206.1 hypothetical protein [Candidatus Krumholzibacteria bacterium]HRY40862.1 hypothetical protein [Candidatus Krumholzibacteria bacterium]